MTGYCSPVRFCLSCRFAHFFAKSEAELTDGTPIACRCPIPAWLTVADKVDLPPSETVLCLVTVDDIGHHAVQLCGEEAELMTDCQTWQENTNRGTPGIDHYTIGETLP